MDKKKKTLQESKKRGDLGGEKRKNNRAGD
jgi:hypothetical protein